MERQASLRRAKKTRRVSVEPCMTPQGSTENHGLDEIQSATKQPPLEQEAVTATESKESPGMALWGTNAWLNHSSSTEDENGILCIEGRKIPDLPESIRFKGLKELVMQEITFDDDCHDGNNKEGRDDDDDDDGSSCSSKGSSDTRAILDMETLMDLIKE